MASILPVRLSTVPAIRTPHVAGVAAMVALLLSALRGKDLNWDLLNYHYYNGWALLHTRFDRDIAAAQLQTWFNPLLDAGLYAAIRHLPPWAVASLYALIESANVVLLFGIARRVLVPLIDDERKRSRLAAALALLGLTGAIFRSEIGGSAGDILVSLPLLASIAVLVTVDIQRGARVAFLLAGLLAGAGAALKLVAAAYVVGFGIASTVLGAPSMRHRFLLPVLFGAGACIGWLVLDGWWCLRLWQRFGNPLFPLFNEWFASAFAATVPLTEARFLPRDVGQVLVYPLYWPFHPRAVSDVGHFLDLRLPLWFALGIAWIVQRLRGRLVSAPHPGVAFLLLGSAVSYVIWLIAFGYYRYLALLEFLAPLAIVLLLGGIVRFTSRLRWALLAAAILISATVQPMKSARGPWSDDYFELRLPQSALRADRGTVVLGGTAPIAFVLPALSQQLDFVRISSNFHGRALRTELDHTIEGRLAAASAPLYALVETHELSAFDERLAQLSLQRNTASCAAIDTVATKTWPEPMLETPLLWCAVERR